MVERSGEDYAAQMKTKRLQVLTERHRRKLVLSCHSRFIAATPAYNVFIGPERRGFGGRAPGKKNMNQPDVKKCCASLHEPCFHRASLPPCRCSTTVPFFTEPPLYGATLHGALFHRASLVQSRCAPAPPRFTEPCFTEPRLYSAAVHLLRHILPSLVSASLVCTVPLLNNCGFVHRASLVQCRCSPA